MAGKIVFIILVFRYGVVGSVDMQPEMQSESFDGKEENLFDVDLIPMTGDEREDDGDTSNRDPSSYIPGSFDPADVQADLIPMYDDYEEPGRQPERQMPRQRPRMNQNEMMKQSPDVDFDVEVKHRLTDDGQVIFEPKIRRIHGGGQSPRQEFPPRQEQNRVFVLPIVTEPPIGGSEYPTPQSSEGGKKKIIIRRVIKRKPGDPGYGTGRVVKIIKRVKQ